MSCQRLQMASVSLQRVLHFTVLLVRLTDAIFASNLQETSTTRSTSITSCFLPSRCRPSVTQLGDSWMSSSAIQAPFMMPQYCETAPSSARHCFPQLVGSSLGTVVIPAWKNQCLLTPYKVPRGQVQARFNRHHASVCGGKSIWKDEGSLEGHPFQSAGGQSKLCPDIIACCAFLHNLCIDMNDVLEDAEAFPPEDGDQSPPPAAACGQESPGHHLRNRISAQLSAPVQMAPHLREHDYI
nr:uncharacterized protein LOC117449939 isoform X1 [Pseudochaenichthys georgianus]